MCDVIAGDTTELDITYEPHPISDVTTTSFYGLIQQHGINTGWAYYQNHTLDTMLALTVHLKI